MSAFPTEICFYGCGNMGSAMLRGWLAAGMAPDRFVVIDPIADNVPNDVSLYRSPQEVKRQFDILVLGIKPQLLPSLAADIATLLAPDALVISILAGTTTRTLSAAFPAARTIRLMPNLAAAIGKSPLAMFAPHADDQARADIASWLTALGTVIWIEDESHMDAVTALAGSGPAFVYRFVDALAKGGEAAGVPHNISAQLAMAMVEGASALAAGSTETPSELAARVTSPGGTTAAGLAVLDSDHILDVLIAQTLRAARDRGTELAKGDTK
ncbi:pyrroline-5-carboxylate reductase [Sphingorhabdus sp.]|uniref:pyrroline-5-carboxylate reductase n=1 Tax=Sphingorhabdus sp. TaxID=1902408 RepID=UPI003919FE22